MKVNKIVSLFAGISLLVVSSSSFAYGYDNEYMQNEVNKRAAIEERWEQERFRNQVEENMYQEMLRRDARNTQRKWETGDHVSTGRDEWYSY